MWYYVTILLYVVMYNNYLLKKFYIVDVHHLLFWVNIVSFSFYEYLAFREKMLFKSLLDYNHLCIKKHILLS